MSFVDICNQVVELARAANAEAEKLGRDAGFGDELVVSVGDPPWDKLKAAPRPRRDVLREHLLSLRLEDLAKIEAVMYVGRGDTDNFHGMYRYLLGLFDSAERLAEDMMGKVPLAEYLEAGLRKAEEQGLDLDGSLWLVGGADGAVEH